MHQTIEMNYELQEMKPFNYKPHNSYTPNEIAEMLGVKPATVYAWLSRKELRATKVGHRRYISKQQLKEFYEQRRTGEYIDTSYAPK